MVSENEIADIVSSWTKIPVQKLAEGESQRLKNLENILHERVVGQDEAVAASGKSDPQRPYRPERPEAAHWLIFVSGPHGVGKTELSKALAEAMFGKEDALIRVDMSEYMEKHSVSKLIGSPPGYVGYEEGGQLYVYLLYGAIHIPLFSLTRWKRHIRIFLIFCFRYLMTVILPMRRAARSTLKIR